MDIYLKVIKGPRAGDLFRVQGGATIGRSRADINLKDPKASSIHAKIETEMGLFYLVDESSSNGTFVGGQKEGRIELKPGLQISIGTSTLEVQTQFQTKATHSQESKWREDVYGVLLSTLTHQNPEAVYAFFAPIVVTIKSGTQEGQRWTLGYGPRKFGASVFGGVLLEPHCPGVCFEIFQKQNSLFIRTDYKNEVFIGREKKELEKIFNGLEIQIGNTLLEIMLNAPNS